MTSNKVIHVKLESDEALQSLKDVLYTEVDLIKIAQAIKRYKDLREKELVLKVGLLKRIKELKLSLSLLKRNLPKLEIPKILKHHETHEIEKELAPVKEKTKKVKEAKQPPVDELEAQLKEIQEKLADLD